MKPADYPEFFRFPAPEGRSRESSIVLDREGRFWHEGALVEHPKLAAAMHSWIGRHPDDGRFILTNGYDWTYFTVEGAPYLVRAIRIEEGNVVLCLSDDTEETWDPATSRVGQEGALSAQVHATRPGGPFEARFTRYAQTSLAPLLVEKVEGGAGANGIALKIGDQTFVIPQQAQ